VLASGADGSVVDVSGEGGLHWTIMVSNGPASTTAPHRVVANGQTFEWTGNYKVEGVR
jgi:hypothetical protein